MGKFSLFKHFRQAFIKIVPKGYAIEAALTSRPYQCPMAIVASNKKIQAALTSRPYQ